VHPFNSLFGGRALALLGPLLLLASGQASAQAPPPAEAAAPAALRLSLAEAVSRLDLGPAGAMARAELDRYDALRTRAAWAFLHEVSVTAAAGYAPTCNADPLNPGQCESETDPLDWTAYRPTFDLRAEGTLLLYTFGKLSAARRQAAAGKQAAIHLARREHGGLVQQIKRAYYGMLLADEMVSMTEDAVGRLEREMERRQRTLRDKKGSWEDEGDEDEDEDEDEPPAAAAPAAAAPAAGAPAASQSAADREIDRLERNRAKLGGYLAKAQGLRAKARAALRTAEDALRIATGEPPGRRVLPADQELRPAIATAPPLAELRSLAQAQNPTLLAAEAGLRAAQAELDRAAADLWPDLVLRGGARFNLTAGADCLVDPSQPAVCRDAQTGYPYAYLGLRWNLEYSELIPRWEEARARYDFARARRDGARMLMDQELSQARAALQEQIELLQARSEAERWARRRRTLAASVCGGLEIVEGPSGGNADCDEAELADALRAYLEARAERLQAIYDLNLALGRLSLTVGRPVGDDVLPAGPGSGGDLR